KLQEFQIHTYPRGETLRTLPALLRADKVARLGGRGSRFRPLGCGHARPRHPATLRWVDTAEDVGNAVYHDVGALRWDHVIAAFRDHSASIANGNREQLVRQAKSNVLSFLGKEPLLRGDDGQRYLLRDGRSIDCRKRVPYRRVDARERFFSLRHRRTFFGRARL